MFITETFKIGELTVEFTNGYIDESKLTNKEITYKSDLTNIKTDIIVTYGEETLAIFRDSDRSYLLEFDKLLEDIYNANRLFIGDKDSVLIFAENIGGYITIKFSVNNSETYDKFELKNLCKEQVQELKNVYYKYLNSAVNHYKLMN